MCVGHGGTGWDILKDVSKRSQKTDFTSGDSSRLFEWVNSRSRDV